jgi:hypothetical protein
LLGNRDYLLRFFGLLEFPFDDLFDLGSIV